MHRIQSLDGLRGLAILLVLGFHGFARWSETIPWASMYSHWPIFKYGYLGVHLFFLISGYVIYLTLDKCSGWGEFMVRRWLRLFPAMLMATLLIMSTAALMPERPGGMPPWVDTLPGLLFLQPNILSKIVGGQVNFIEGAFWSLIIEVNFYIIFGALYFYSKNKCIYLLVAVFMVAFFYHAAIKLSPDLSIKAVNTVVTHILGLQHFGWFAMGALVYRAHKDAALKFFLMALALLPFAILETSWLDLPVAMACVVVFSFFSSVIFLDFAKKIMTSRFIIFMGFISYPFYLLHESAMVALTIKAREHMNFLPGILTPAPGIMLIVFISWLVARYAEPFLKAKITNGLSFFQSQRLA